ncbi:MAG TPA: DUF4956 domain-containing protein [Vicinamibacterales bacterium]|nr:DUF4956 domain-containing protein [Vicinamibacterales bacterium]
MNPGSETIASIGPGPALLVLLLAALSAMFLGILYHAAQGRDSSGADLRTAFPLIGLALTGLFLTVQLSIPVSLGLLAALTVVRFRTRVKEPEEIAFVVALVSVSVLLATLRLALAGVMLGTAVLAVLATRALRARQRTVVHGLLVLSMSEEAASGTLGGLAATGCRLQSITTAGAETVFSFRFASRSESHVLALERDLARRLPHARSTVLVDTREALR